MMLKRISSSPASRSCSSMLSSSRSPEVYSRSEASGQSMRAVRKYSAQSSLCSSGSPPVRAIYRMSGLRRCSRCSSPRQSFIASAYSPNSSWLGLKQKKQFLWHISDRIPV